MKQPSAGQKKFTGYHATTIIVAFFGVVICVNLLMAFFAVSTFGGTVVDNSYVASQKYNQWLVQARAQENNRWNVSSIARVKDHATLSVSNVEGIALQGALITALAEHPVGRADPYEMQFNEIRPGFYQSIDTIPEGRWKLKLLITYQGNEKRLIGDIR